MSEEEMKNLRARVIAALESTGAFDGIAGSGEPDEAHILMAYDVSTGHDIQLTIDLV